MPHKRNPVVCERVSGLARVIRGHAQAALENVALWHERDISHSSAERMIFPDATGLLAFMLHGRDLGARRARRVPRRRCRSTSSRAAASRLSQSVLLALVDAGVPRDDAYAIVQRAAAAAWDEGASFRERSRPIPRSGRTSTTPCSTSCSTRGGSYATSVGSSRSSRSCRWRFLSPVSATGGLHAQGKVRDVYEAGPDALLLVATDRISAFDVDPAEPDPRQGPGADGLLAVLVRADERPGRQPPAHREPLGVPAAVRRGDVPVGARDAREARRGRADRVRGARLPERLGLEGVPERGAVCGVELPVGLVGVRPPARADLHADHEGGRRPRPAGHLRTRPSTSSGAGSSSG